MLVGTLEAPSLIVSLAKFKGHGSSRCGVMQMEEKSQ